MLKCKEFNPLKLKVTEDRVFQINGNQEHVVVDFFLNFEDLHYGFNITIANGESVTYYTQHPIIGVGVSEIENDIILIYEYGKSINWKIYMYNYVIFSNSQRTSGLLDNKMFFLKNEHNYV